LRIEEGATEHHNKQKAPAQRQRATTATGKEKEELVHTPN